MENIFYIAVILCSAAVTIWAVDALISEIRYNKAVNSTFPTPGQRIR